LSALIAAGQSAQISFHLNTAMDKGLTQAQAAEVLTHLAFYAGWPNIPCRRYPSSRVPLTADPAGLASESMGSRSEVALFPLVPIT
jgi:hypothetical protein